MLISDVDFIKTPKLYLDRVETESILIMKDGRTIAVLAKPSDTPITDSLVGILKNKGIHNVGDIKALKVEG